MAKSTRGLIIMGGSLIIVIAVIFFFIPIAMTSMTSTTPTTQVPAQFGDTSVEEMIVQTQPVTTFCKIYPNADTCR